MGSIANHIELFDFVLRLSLAIFCGFLIGLERQWINRVAGIQTNALVCAGSCLFILSSYFMSYEGQSASRITAQIVSGIGFLGAGMIFKDGFNAHGINTAANIWVCAAIGVLCGLGLLPYAILSASIFIAGNTVFRKLDHAISKNRRWADLRRVNKYKIEVVMKIENIKKVRSEALKFIAVHDHVIVAVQTEFIKDGMARVSITFTTHFVHHKNIEDVCEKIENLEEALIVDWSQNNN